MQQELKISISNYQELEEKLKDLGASFVEEKTFIDTYLTQSKGEVLKVAQINDSYFLERLKAIEGKFQIIKNQKIEDANTANKLINKYGLKSILQGKRRYFRFSGFKITINLINNVGEFLIITGENPTEKFITEKLRIKNPEYIHVPFNELPETNFKILK